MNATDQNPNADVDRMLSTFFKSELPDPFPLMKFPAARANLPMPVNASRLADSQSISKSRFALAVSVALLLGGCWYLSGQIGNAPEQPKIGKGDNNAKLPKEILKAKDELKNSTMP